MSGGISYHYTLKPQRLLQLKTQFYRLTCSRNGNPQYLTKAEVLHFLLKQNLDIKMSNLTYFDHQLFKQDNKTQYSCKQAITLADRLSISLQVEKQFAAVFNTFDIENKGRITVMEMKRTVNRCANSGMGTGPIKKLEDHQIQQIFNQLDVDQDGLVSYEDFLCAMITK